ncbi:MAG: DUF2312 domain-containing protein [Rickettsiales bacterium]|jgi:uncharacterized protein (UPF0335 family)|nr:DUF2312 domain-containing protein [Rickettsiales bacterium]
MAKENKGGIAADQLVSIVERIEKLNEEAANVAADIKEVYAEAKGIGFDTKYIRQIVRLRKMDPDEITESDEMLALYREAIGI